MRKAWKVFVTIVQCPVRYPLCALAWWIAGMWLLGCFMAGGLYPDSASAVFLDLSSRYLAPVCLIVFPVLLLGIVGGPWCLLYQFLTGKLFGGNGKGTR